MDITVVVYREEEVIKVLIHELIHALGIDYAEAHTDIMEQSIAKEFHTNKPLRVNESFTDTWACLLNTCLYASLHQHVRKAMKPSFEMIFMMEQKYIISKGSQVMERVYNMRKQHGSWIEQTHVISYYIIKALNFMYIDTFLEQFTSRTNGKICISKGSIHMYMDWLEKHIHDTVLQSLASYKKTEYVPNFEEKQSSLRMSNIDCMQFVIIGKNKVFKSIVA